MQQVFQGLPERAVSGGMGAEKMLIERRSQSQMHMLVKGFTKFGILF
jgi:hypothetical protein